jgi:hypothetical protein
MILSRRSTVVYKDSVLHAQVKRVHCIFTFEFCILLPCVILYSYTVNAAVLYDNHTTRTCIIYSKVFKINFK